MSVASLYASTERPLGTEGGVVSIPIVPEETLSEASDSPDTLPLLSTPVNLNVNGPVTPSGGTYVTTLFIEAIDPNLV